MIDSHTHLYLPDFLEDIEDVMLKCKEIGIKKFILPNIDKNSIESMKSLQHNHPDTCHLAMGLHPTEVRDDWEQIVQEMEKEIATGKYLAVGEIGLDLYWDKSYKEQQIKAFKHQLELAGKYNLPVIIHCREALNEILNVIDEIQPKTPLIFHSFTGSSDDVKKIRKVCNPYFGINGVVTYKNAPDLRVALQEIGIKHILLETDSPYLSPVPKRGKRNDSSHLIYVRDKIAEELGISPIDVDKITDQNAEKIFDI